MSVPARGTAAVALRPALQALKQRAEVALEKRSGDVVVFSKNLSDRDVGVTDVSFEHRQNEKHVSLYFTSKPEGLLAYRHAAAKVSHIEGVDLQYTPQFGQSRISFPWHTFWALAETEQLGQLSPRGEPLLQLTPRDLHDAMDPGPDATGTGETWTEDFVDIDGVHNPSDTQ